MLDWAGESQYYVEPKRLAKLGYLEARREPGKTRERTVYTLTEKGLDALHEYAKTPVRFTPLKSDPLLRLLLCDLVGEPATRASLADPSRRHRRPDGATRRRRGNSASRYPTAASTSCSSPSSCGATSNSTSNSSTRSSAISPTPGHLSRPRRRGDHPTRRTAAIPAPGTFPAQDLENRKGCKLFEGSNPPPRQEPSRIPHHEQGSGCGSRTLRRE